MVTWDISLNLTRYTRRHCIASLSNVTRVSADMVLIRFNAFSDGFLTAPVLTGFEVYVSGLSFKMRSSCSSSSSSLSSLLFPKILRLYISCLTFVCYVSNVEQLIENFRTADLKSLFSSLSSNLFFVEITRWFFCVIERSLTFAEDWVRCFLTLIWDSSLRLLLDITLITARFNRGWDWVKILFVILILLLMRVLIFESIMW